MIENMKLIFLCLLLLMTGTSKAEVLSKMDLQSFNLNLYKLRLTNQVNLKHVEMHAVFNDGEFQYLDVYSEADVKVSEGPGVYIWAPESSAFKSFERVMKSFCESVNGKEISNLEKEVLNKETSTHAGLSEGFFGRSYFTYYTTWDYQLGMSLRCK